MLLTILRLLLCLRSKKVENFIFFNIIDDNFTKKLAEIIPHITTSSTVIEKLKEVDNVRRQYGDRPKERRRQHYVKLEQVNIAFSPAGLTALSIDPSGVGDNLYTQGQLKDAVLGLGDHPDNSGAPIPDWEPEFKSTLHGVFIIASECKPLYTPRTITKCTNKHLQARRLWSKPRKRSWIYLEQL